MTVLLDEKILKSSIASAPAAAVPVYVKVTFAVVELSIMDTPVGVTPTN